MQDNFPVMGKKVIIRFCVRKTILEIKLASIALQDRSFMVNLLNDFSFHVFHDLCNKGRGIGYPVCELVHIKEPLLLIGKTTRCGGSEFPLSLSGPLPYV